MYGWLDVDFKDMVKSVSIKSPIREDLSLPIVLGSFTFKHAKYFKELF